MPSQIPDRDRCAIIAEVERIGARSVLEFGPGESTALFLSMGLSVVTCENDRHWLDRAVREYPEADVRRYHNTPSAVVDGDLARYDLAFVDSPLGTPDRERLGGQEDCSRLNTLMLALEHAPVVLLHDCYRTGEQASIARLAVDVEYLTPGSDRTVGKGLARITKC